MISKGSRRLANFSSVHSGDAILSAREGWRDGGREGGGRREKSPSPIRAHTGLHGASTRPHEFLQPLVRLNSDFKTHGR